jgi:hypothetical protein
MDRSKRHVRAPAPARSNQEISLYLNVVVCPACAHEGVVAIGDVRDHAPELTAVVTARCPICLVLIEMSFLPGPGWDSQPALDDPRLACGETPSLLIPESLFRTNADDSARRLEDTDLSRTSLRASLSSLGLRDLIELRKFKRAAGSDLDAKDRALLRHFGEVFVASGENLPADLAELVKT